MFKERREMGKGNRGDSKRKKGRGRRGIQEKRGMGEGGKGKGGDEWGTFKKEQ